jgi:hypothetical protein
MTMGKRVQRRVLRSKTNPFTQRDSFIQRIGQAEAFCAAAFERHDLEEVRKFLRIRENHVSELKKLGAPIPFKAAWLPAIERYLERIEASPALKVA